MASRTSKLSIKKILVPTDFSDLSLDALDFAGSIAKNTGAGITLLHVMESYEHNTKLKLPINISEVIEKGIRDKIEDIKTSNKSLWGIELESKVVEGKIHAGIDNFARKEKVGLIVMGTHGVSGVTNIGKYIIGSNAYRTIHNAPCPIITIREKRKNPSFKNILLPIASNKETMQKVDTAIEWAELFDSTIHIVALTAFFEELFVEYKDMKRKVGQVELKLEKAGIPFTSHIIRHQALSESVLQYARKINADIIFIATGSDSRLNEMLLGSAVRTVVSESKFPVLTINTRK